MKTIPEDECEFIASRSGGPGGQNVNKVSSRVTLRWSIAESRTLTSAERERIEGYPEIDQRTVAGGIVQITVQRHRSQHRNREEALERLNELVAKALEPKEIRRPTKIPRSEKTKRRESKRKRAIVKRGRGGRIGDD